MLLRPGVSSTERHAAAHDCIGAKSTGLFPLQVHRAASAAAVTLRETENFGQGALKHNLNIEVDQIGYIEAGRRDIAQRLCQKLVVTAV